MLDKDISDVHEICNDFLQKLIYLILFELIKIFLNKTFQSKNIANLHQFL